MGIHRDTKLKQPATPNQDKAQTQKDKLEPSKQSPAPISPKVALVQEIRDVIRSLEKAVPRRDDRILISSAKHNSRFRKGVSTSVLKLIINEILSYESKLHAKLITAIDIGIIPDADDEAVSDLPILPPRSNPPLPEVETFIYLLVSMFVFDHGDKVDALDLSTDLVNRISALNRRTLDRLAAKSYQFWALCLEESGKLHETRKRLIASHRSACLRHDEPGQAVLCNLIIRSFLLCNLYMQADKFRLNSNFPQGRSNYQTARYLYYIGKINSVQLRYSDAHTNLTAAIRKAPSKAAIGFRQAATKLSVVVQLLMGDIPERSLFFEATLNRSLRPYFQLTQAVRIGDLANFSQVQMKYASIFERDGTLNLITRLRFNVIKVGLRKLSLSYSRISISEIASRLKLKSVEDSEYIIAKAINDGVIDALIDRENGYLYSTENVDVYSTTEPQAQFHKRIEFCLDMYNSAVMSMRFPDTPTDKDDEGDERAAEHDQILEVLEEELKDEDLDDFIGDHE